MGEAGSFAQGSVLPDGPAHVPATLVRNYDMITYTMLGEHGDIYDFYHSLSEGPRALYNATPCLPILGHDGGMWILTRAEDIRTALQNPQIFSAAGLPLGAAIGEPDMTLIPIELDPPAHGKFRSLLNPLFSPTKVRQMEDELRDHAAGHIECILAQGECEFVADFGRKFPIHFFMKLMGLPQEDAAQLIGWEEGILHSQDFATCAAASRAVTDYLLALIARRRSEPAGDIVSYCLSAEIDGRKLTDNEILGVCMLQFMAGLDTVTAALGLQFKFLAENPSIQSQLRQDPSRIPNAVEELLRRFSIIAVPKTVAQDVEWAGVAMKAGEMVLFATPLANLDPRHFDDPMAVDITRENIPHVAFFYGPHRCLGSHLARRELVIAMEEWLARVPPFSVKPGAEISISPGSPICVPELPLVW